MSNELQRLTLALQEEKRLRREAQEGLRARELEFADFVENASMGLHRVAGDGTILWANKAELDLLGYDAHEYIGRHISEFHADEPIINDILTRLSSGNTLIDYPARLRCKDGSIKHVLIHSNGRFDDDQLRYTRCFTRDVTDRVGHETVLIERAALLEELEVSGKAKDEFLAMLGHELRNPLAPIVTALELMKRRGELKSSKEQGIIERQVQHLIRLVDDLLDVSRITRGTVELRSETIEFADALDKAVEMASLLVEQRQQTLIVDYPKADLKWHGDPTRLTQIVCNLLTNAARYSSKGSRIELKATVNDENIRITVKDNGKGIAADVLPRIFDLFFQVPQNLERSQGGLGIGLALIKSLVTAHGGSVEATSQGLGHGSEFIVCLPRAHPMKSAGTETLYVPPAAKVSRRLMIVDDNHDAADLLGEFLELSGHQVVVAYDPLSALKLAASYQPEVAFLDIGLPVMSGYELADQLRSELGADKACRMFAVTGFGQEMDKISSAKGGFEAHFVKPVDILSILAVIDQVH